MRYPQRPFSLTLLGAAILDHVTSHLKMLALRRARKKKMPQKEDTMAMVSLGTADLGRFSFWPSSNDIRQGKNVTGSNLPPPLNPGGRGLF